MERLWQIRYRHELSLAAVLILLAGTIAVINPAFLSLSNLFDLCKSSTVLGIFALGVFIVLLSGGIDISFTAIAAFSMYVTSSMLPADASGSAVVAFLCAGCIGLLLGLFNAFFISFYRLPTLIVTLGSASVFRGFLLGVVGTRIVTNLPRGMIEFSKRSLFETALPDGGKTGLSASFLLFIAAAAAAWTLLRYTTLGKGIRALGGNAEAARRVGFTLGRVQFFIYGLVGFLSAIAGIIHACTMRNANPFDLVGMELTVIAAVVLGGADITGGRGTVAGTLLGVALLVTLRYEKDLGEWPESLEQLVEAGYLDRVPLDCYSDGPLVYKRTADGFLLYSFGADFDDDGGTPSKWGEGEKGGDQVFWLVPDKD